jgi:hypothetical protein
MLDKMHRVISNPTQSDLHQAIISACFGPISERKRNAIKENIQKMKNADVRLRTNPEPISGPRMLNTGIIALHNGHVSVAFRPDSVAFGQYTHSAPEAKKAAELIHQSAMYAGDANSDARPTQRRRLKIVTLGESGPHIHKNLIDYTGRPRNPRQVNANEAWTFIKHNTVNMQNSAAAYRVMAHLCDETIPTPRVAESRTTAGSS